MRDFDTSGDLEVARAHHLAGRRAAAEELCRGLLERQPRHAGALHLLSLMAHAQKRLRPALKLARMAVAAAPLVPGYRNTLGIILGDIGQWDDSLAALCEAIRLDPGNYDAHRNLGVALARAGRPDEAVRPLRRATELRPGAEPHGLLGSALRAQGRIGEAESAHREAVRLGPDEPQANGDLAAALFEQGQASEAVECLRHVTRLRPASAAAGSELLYALHYLAAHTPEQLFREHLDWAERHADPLRASIRPHNNERSPDRVLRIGYVSPDLREHPVTRFLEPLLKHHDAGGFDVYCYSDVGAADSVTRRLQGYGRVWREIAGITDEAVAQIIREDAIDILVDETGHMARNRLLVFARKPAPIQVTHNGYINTTGMGTMDYRLTDADHDPPGEADRLHTEDLVRLPHLWCYEADGAGPDVAPLPALSAGCVTFGCLNNLAKLTEDAVRLWAEIITATPGSRLMVAATGGDAGQNGIRQIIERCGVPSDKLTLVPKAPNRADYLRRYWQIDVALDPFPFNGITTTCDAFWMGVPVVTLAGETHVSRAGVSLANTVDLPGLVAPTRPRYVQIAVALARDLPNLATLRGRLRPRMRSSPMMNGPEHARDVEAAYRRMWRAWCLGGRNGGSPRGRQADTYA